MDSSVDPKPVVTIGGQEVALDAPSRGVKEPGEAIGPIPVTLDLSVPAVADQGGDGSWAVLAVVGLGSVLLALAVGLTVRWLAHKRL